MNAMWWWVTGVGVAFVLGVIGAVTRRQAQRAEAAALPEGERQAWNVDDAHKRDRASLLTGLLAVLAAVVVGVGASGATATYPWAAWAVPIAFLVAAWGVRRIGIYFVVTLPQHPRTRVERAADFLAGNLLFVPFALQAYGVLLAVTLAAPYVPPDIDVGQWVTWGLVALGPLVWAWKRSFEVALLYVGIAYLARLAVGV